jgi:gas vesicle protein
MVLKNLLDMTGKEKKRKQRVKTAQMVALGVGVAAVTAAAGVATGILIAPKSGKETRKDMKKRVLSFNDAVQRKAVKIKNSAADAAQTVGNAIKDIHKKTTGVNQDIKDGLHDIKRDIQHTAKHVSHELGNQ